MINRKRSDFRTFKTLEGYRVQEIVAQDSAGNGLYIDWPQLWDTREGAQSAIDELFDADVDSEAETLMRRIRR